MLPTLEYCPILPVPRRLAPDCPVPLGPASPARPCLGCPLHRHFLCLRFSKRKQLCEEEEGMIAGFVQVVLCRPESSASSRSVSHMVYTWRVSHTSSCVPYSSLSRRRRAQFSPGPDPRCRLHYFRFWFRFASETPYLPRCRCERPGDPYSNCPNFQYSP
uniref:Uncharacterized protein n=1 Tax=Cacopsylla melanoneura TaxID=428564 RepID=A0A8D9AHE1_9HEMI